MKKYFFIYVTTCMVTGRYYIGKHSTKNINDGYLGSGDLIRQSIQKYGKGAHTCKILEIGADENDIRRLEAIAISEQVLADPLCMNKAPGGQGGNIGGGGFFSAKHKAAFHSAGGNALAAKRKSDPEFDHMMQAKKSSGIKKFLQGATEEIKAKRVKSQRLATNAAHRPEAKAKRKLTCKINGHSCGSNNPNYGRKWMNNGIINKGVPLSEIDVYLANGYIFGLKRRTL